MKKKFLSFVLAVCMLIPCAIFSTACTTNPPEADTYTVTEAEWKVNFNLTKEQVQPQSLGLSVAEENQTQKQLFLSAQAQPLTAITSYTLYAEGESGGLEGNALLKLAPNGMYIEFYLENNLREDESGTYAKTEVLYQTLKQNIMSYFPFANNYNDFTFDQSKKAYVSQNLTSIMVDDYDPSKSRPVYTKSAEVKFVNGYLNTVFVVLCQDANFTDEAASFLFTFSNINNTTVTI